MIHLDTNVLVDALTGPRRSAAALRRWFERAERISFSTIVLYEWRRGPRRPEELHAQETLFPLEETAVFGAREAAIAADLYRKVRRPRGREIDLAIAACAIARDAVLWSLNLEDFVDIPGLQMLREPPA